MIQKYDDDSVFPALVIVEVWADVELLDRHAAFEDYGRWLVRGGRRHVENFGGRGGYGEVDVEGGGIGETTNTPRFMIEA